MPMNSTRAKLSTVVLLVILFANLSASTAVEKPTPAFGALDVSKYIEKTELKIGEQTIALVNVTNYGNSSAYNVTIAEPITPKGVLRLENTPHIDFIEELKPNASYVYYFQFKLVEDENVFIPPTRITWYDINGTKYEASSQGYFLSPLVEKQQTSEGRYWLYLSLISVGIIALPAIPLLFIRYKK